ncbi:MAG: cation diffusion facilitator family transporter [Firmicutes bacterium]|nr:cation diffusion facilitator family transporter [Bacillota bacterium]
MLLNFTITLAEVIGGIFANSLSLLSDALHNFSDGLAIIISYLAIKISSRANDEKRTFGYRRASIMAAIINASVLIGISVFLFKEAYQKIIHPHSINGGVVIWVALVGLVANTLSVFLLQKGLKENLNIKSAYFHLLSDALSSAGVVIGGIAIYYWRLYWIDPLLTIAISIYVLKESYGILTQAINILMQGAPSNINLDEIIAAIKKVAGVEQVHHVHLWSLDEQNINFEAHIDVKDMLVSKAEIICGQIAEALKEHGITHTTLQCECSGCKNVGIIKQPDENCGH